MWLRKVAKRPAVPTSSRRVNNDPDSYNVPTWKLVAAIVGILVIITLATLFWMWRDNKPRRRPALLGAPEPALRTNAPATK
jgi:hypothetical protein